MNHTCNVKYTIAAICVAATTGFAGIAAAQDISKGPRDAAVSQETKDEASKRTKDLSSRLDQDRTTDDQSAKGPGMTKQEFEDEQQEMTPEEIDALKRKIESKNRTMIKKLNRIIKGDPYSDKKPAWMFQKAELMWELRNMEYLRARAQYNQCLSASDQGTASDCTEPSPDYTKPQKIYKKILTQYPDYSRLDEVIYRLGSGLIEAGKGIQAVNYLSRLVKNYRNSKYLPDANLALAEHFFDKNLLGAARNKYQAVLKYKNDQNYDFALYKLGWVYYNQNKFRKSIDTFKNVVERTNKKLGFQNQAINDLVVAFSEVEDGWKEMRKYFLEQRDRKFTYKKLGQMARLYEGQGKDKQAVAIYEYFIDKRPDNKRIPEWMESVIVAKKKINDFDDLEKTMNRYLAYLDPNGTWAKKNKDEEGALNNASLLSQASLAFLANKYHRRAQDHDARSDYKAAVGYYKEFIDRFPKQPASFDMNYFVGDIYLLELDNYQRAANFYQKVVDLKKAGKTPEDAKDEDVAAIVKDSAYGVVNAYNELVKEHEKDSVLVEMAKFEEEHGDEEVNQDTVDASTDAKPNPKVALKKYEKGFVKASDQYSEMYPDDEITPTIDYVAAEVYKSRGHYESAIPRYENIIENASEHRYASYAGGSLLVANYVLKNWKEVEKWARYMMENKIFDVTPKEDLKQAIALAINERAKQLRDADKFDEATSELLRLAKEFPDSEFAPGALFNAGAIYESGEQTNKAVDAYERVVQEYPKSAQAPKALFVMGAIFKTRANFGKAAEYFARMGSTKTYVNEDGDEVEYKNHPKTPDALFNAASLREAMEQWDEAIAAGDKYVELYKGADGHKEDVKLIMKRLPYLEQERQNWSAALERFKKYGQLDSVSEDEQVMVNSEMGRLVEKIEKDDWKEKSNELFDASLEIWKGLGDDAQKKWRYYAAQARFRQAERIFDKFKAVKLTFPMSKLKKGLVEKAKIQQKAQKVFLEVIDMGSKKWLAASAYRIGQTYRDFAGQLENLPIPEGLSERQRMDYQFTLQDKIRPLKKKALARFRGAVRLALDKQAYNEWSYKSARQIASMEPKKFPIRNQKQVKSDHGRINFFVPAPHTDLEAIAERVAERKPAPKPKSAPSNANPDSGPTRDGAAKGRPASQASK